MSSDDSTRGEPPRFTSQGMGTFARFTCAKCAKPLEMTGSRIRLAFGRKRRVCGECARKGMS